MDDNEAQRAIDELIGVIDSTGLRWIVDDAVSEIAIEELDEDAGKVVEFDSIATSRVPSIVPARQRLLLLIASIRTAITQSNDVESEVATFFTSEAQSAGMRSQLIFSRDTQTISPQIARLDTDALADRAGNAEQLLVVLDELATLARQ